MLALPLLGARCEKMARKPATSPCICSMVCSADVAGPVQVQDQPGPQALGRLQPEGPFDDHPGLVVYPLDRPARLPGVEVVQDLLLPVLKRMDEGRQLREVGPACPGITRSTPDGPCGDPSPCQRSSGTAPAVRTTSATAATSRTAFPASPGPPGRVPPGGGGTPTSTSEIPSAPPGTASPCTPG